MKNILGTQEDLELFTKEGEILYRYIKNSDGYRRELTYDSSGKESTYKNSDGFSREHTYDSSGNESTYKDSTGFSSEYTYDSRGNVSTYKDSTGVSRGFDIPEYTMEELVKKWGNFKIKK